MKNNITVFFITILSPFLGLLISLYYWRKTWAKNVFWIVCMYMGAIHIFHPEGTMLGVGADGGRYVIELIDMYSMNVTWDNIAASFFVDGKTLDLFQPILTFLISRFTSNGHVLFFFFAVVFGFFYSRNIWYVLEKLPDKLKNWTWVLVASYFLICPIWQINGVRMWTALHVFVYGAMPFIIDKNRSKLIWCVLAIFIHFSFIYPVIVLFIYAFLPKNKINIYLIFYVITLFIKEIDLTSLRDLLTDTLPSIYDRKVNIYLSEDYANTINDQQQEMSLHVILAQRIAQWIIQFYILLSYILIKKHLNNNDKIKRLYIFALIIYGASNILSLIPSGGRFILISQMFMIPLFLFVISYVPPNSFFRFVHPVMMLLALFSVIFNIRVGLDFYGLSLVVGNFLTMFFMETNTPIIYYVKQIF